MLKHFFLIGWFTSLAIFPLFAEWQPLQNKKLPKNSFLAAKQGKTLLYFCRDHSGNIGHFTPKIGCHLIMGPTQVSAHFQVLVDRHHNYGWQKRQHSAYGWINANPEALLKPQKLCMKAIGDKQFLGLVIDKRCYYRINQRAKWTRSFNVLVKQWVAPEALPIELGFAPKWQKQSLIPCRVRENGIYLPGFSRFGEQACEYSDPEGLLKVSSIFEWQVNIPHKWQGLTNKGFPANAIPAGHDKTFYICRVAFLGKLYIGKIERQKCLCEINLKGGVVEYPDFQIQVKTIL